MIARRALLRSRPLARSISYTKPKPAPDATASTSTTATTNGSKTTPAAAKPAAKPSFTTQQQKSRPTAQVPSNLIYKPSTIAHTSSSATDATAAGKAESNTGSIDWANSFHGISTKPVSEEQFQVLMQPLSERDIEVKPDGIIYLPEIKYRRRLNEAFGPMGWGLIPKGDAVVGDSIVTREYALIVDGRFVSQAQGENSYFSADQLPSAVEGCKSNALMRCCKDLGIGSELWDPQFIKWFKKNQMEEVWVEHATTKKKRTLWYRKGEVDVAYPYRQTR